MPTTAPQLRHATPVLAAGAVLVALFAMSCDHKGSSNSSFTPTPTDPVVAYAQQMIAEGRETFRYETFGDESFWGDTLRLHEAIAGAANGGVGPGVSPATALALGLKVDAEKLPQSVVDGITNGTVDLDDPATTLALLQLDAVVGVKGIFDTGGQITGMGITCALCHSVVDDSFSAGIGKRLDGWANRDLNVGAIVASAPDLSAFQNLLGVNEQTVKDVLNSWGPGKFDAHLNLDGKAFHPSGGAAAVLIPPAFGLAGVELATWTGWGSVPYWNAFVSKLEMNGRGPFLDTRLNDGARHPVAANNGFGMSTDTENRITSKLAALHYYQLSLAPPEAPAGSYDVDAAARGEVLFSGSAQCSTCHVEPLYTEPGRGLHTPAEMGIDSFQADRSPTGQYRTAPLRGLWSHTKGGFFHDGRFATLHEVVEHYNTLQSLGLTTDEIDDLVEFLKSI